MHTMAMRVVIAEDEWLTAMLLRAELERQGYEVIGVAGTGTKAVSLCAEEAPDVVLMDVQMPEMDGLEATRALMGKRPTCVIIVTGTAREAEAEEAGAMEYVPKPLLGEQVAGVVERARERFQQFLAVRDGAVGLDATLARWRAVRKAVATLAEGEHLSEREAFLRLQQQAMDQGATLSAVAEGVLARQTAGPAH